MWHRHWGLVRDPFDDVHSPYVSLPSHDEALYRLAHAIERGHRHAVFRAEAGLGKTMVLRRAIAEARGPRRRVALIHAPADEAQLLDMLADGLGPPVGAGREAQSQSQSPWRALGRTLRVASLQGFQVVLGIDDWDGRSGSPALRDLNALAHQGFGPEARLTVIRAGRTAPDDQPDQAEDGWALAIGLKRLTRSQVETYLAAKLAAAGCGERLFTPRAITRLHGISGGVPRALESLAAWGLMAGAARGLEVVSPDIVDGVAEECLPALSPAIAR